MIAILQALALGTVGYLVGKLLGLALAAWIDNAPYRFPRWMSPFERAFRTLAKAIDAIFDLHLRATRGLAHAIGSVGQTASRRRHGARR